MVRKKYAPEGECTPLMHLTPGELERVEECGEIIEGTAVMCDTELNLKVSLGGGLYGTIPRNEALHEVFGIRPRDIAIVTRVGKQVCCKIKSIDRRTGKIILSRAAAQADCEANYIKKLRMGDIIFAKVTHLEPFGAFTDIGCGIPALLPIDFISVSRIRHPADRLCVRDTIRAVVAGIDPCTGRITLSMRELMGTWAENAGNFHVGETVAGIIRGRESYGVFIELAPNLAGLAEAPADTDETPYPIGAGCAVYIKSILPERMKVKLVVVDVNYNGSPDAPHKSFAPPVYFLPEDVAHIDRWLYSPENAPAVKQIVTSFV